VNGHHQNRVAERGVCMVSEMAQAMILHATLQWNMGIDSSFWPMTVSYATYLYNHLPANHGIAPANLFTGVQVPCHKLRHLHVWGCPVYILDPTLQQGKKLPCWEPRMRLGVFVGFSQVHATDVPLVLNRTTGSISPQYYVVFDNLFTTVLQGESDTVPDHWDDLCLASTHAVPIDSTSPVHLSNEWLSPEDINIKRREEMCLD